MRLHRFIRPVNLSQGILRLNDAEMLNQLKNVFRLGEGAKIIIADGRGGEAMAEIKSFYKDGVELAVTDVSKKAATGKITALYLAIIKKDNFETAVQKAVECGISQVVPLVTNRTVKTNLNMERLRKIALEAAEQCGRADIPQIDEPVKFTEAVVRSSGENVLLDRGGEPIDGKLNSSAKVSVWIGPEGGWDEDELEKVRIKGFKVISLGPLTLRAETAAIIGAYLAVHRDMRI